jgi:signal peptidase I
VIAVALAIAAGIYVGIDIAVVPTPSMESTILVGDHVIVDKLLYGPSIGNGRFRLPAVRAPKRNDVVSFHPPGSDEVFVKRVIAGPGDTIELRARRFLVNGEDVGARQVGASRHFREGELLSIPDGMLFVLGDNRSASEDSREFGLVPKTAVIGEPVVVCWSIAIPQREWFNENGDIRTAAYLSWMTHFVSLTRWHRFGKPL